MNDDRGARRGAAVTQRTAAVAAMAATGILAVACGGSSQPPGRATSSGGNLAVVLDSYASCMRSHGVPNFYFTHRAAPPSAPPPGTFVLGYHGWFAKADPGAQLQSALKACRHLLPFGKAQGIETHQEFLAAVKTAACMRSHGYPNWPDPNPDASGVWMPAGIDTASPQFHDAAKTCGVPVPPAG